MTQWQFKKRTNSDLFIYNSKKPWWNECKFVLQLDNKSILISEIV